MPKSKMTTRSAAAPIAKTTRYFAMGAVGGVAAKSAEKKKAREAATSPAKKPQPPISKCAYWAIYDQSIFGSNVQFVGA